MAFCKGSRRAASHQVQALRGGSNATTPTVCYTGHIPKPSAEFHGLQLGYYRSRGLTVRLDWLSSAFLKVYAWMRGVT